MSVATANRGLPEGIEGIGYANEFALVRCSWLTSVIVILRDVNGSGRAGSTRLTQCTVTAAVSSPSCARSAGLKYRAARLALPYGGQRGARTFGSQNDPKRLLAAASSPPSASPAIAATRSNRSCKNLGRERRCRDGSASIALSLPNRPATEVPLGSEAQRTCWVNAIKNLT
jgi:hypothetical protein